MKKFQELVINKGLGAGLSKKKWNEEEKKKALNKAIWDDVEQKDIASFEAKIIEKCRSEKPEIIDSIISSGKLEDDVEKLLNELILDLKKNFNS